MRTCLEEPKKHFKTKTSISKYLSTYVTYEGYHSNRVQLHASSPLQVSTTFRTLLKLCQKLDVSSRLEVCCYLQLFSLKKGLEAWNTLDD